jgi:hypothetical protein
MSSGGRALKVGAVGLLGARPQLRSLGFWIVVECTRKVYQEGKLAGI